LKGKKKMYWRYRGRRNENIEDEHDKRIIIEMK